MSFSDFHVAVNTVWMLVCAALVFFLQAGFCCMESGLSRSKNSINAAIKNVADFCIAGSLFWLTGYALMFGKSFHGLVGTTDFFFEETSSSNWLTVFFLYQLMFCGTSSTIASGAVAERMRFKAYAIMSAIVGGIIYPIFGHWVWSRPGAVAQGWLAQLGFVDFAGSTVVHSLAAWAALAAIILVGPRTGRFPADAPPKKFHGHSLPMAALGLFILWFGWFGFTGGKTLALNSQVPEIWINTLLAGVFGGMGNLLWQLICRKQISIDSFMNGILAGLVAICASCQISWDAGAIIIGLSAGLLQEVATEWLERRKLDDVVGVVAVHGIAGAFGTLMVAVVTPAAEMPAGWSRLGLFAAQLLGVLVCFAWSFGICFVGLKLVSRFMPLRVSEEEEQAGLNLAEHDARTDLHDLLVTMEQNMLGNLARRAAADTCTEAGLIAHQYNQVLNARERAEEELTGYARRLEATNAQVNQQRATLEAQAEAIEAARAEAERANQTKSQFVANLSHEIRTPMTAILGYVDLLLEDVDSADPQAAKWSQQLSTIRTNGHHLLEIINDILDVSKIEAGKLTVEKIDSSLVQIIGDVATLLRQRAEAKGLRLVVNYLTPIPATIQTDPTRVRQILLNLVGNSIKFTASGEVRVEVSLLDPQSPRPRLRIDVIDTGIGMTSEQLARLFQPFVQADSSTTRKFGGTGLGLTISHRLAQLLDGHIEVNSQPGEGSTFRVLLPCGPLAGVALVERPGEATAAVATAPPRKLEIKLASRVLLAEDGPDNQRLISHLLRKAGATVTVADNGQQAVDLALAAWRGPRGTGDPDQPFDVILMDIQMPVLDGCQATARLREEGYPLPIVALTANAMREDRERCLAAGCDDFATKPIDRTVLLSTVSRWSTTPQPTPSTGG
ncbi:MAG: ammonium transporter [Pirellulaceae bacterium]|nr:ammonium transporter [Pirellulaceae bacterium]